MNIYTPRRVILLRAMLLLVLNGRLPMARRQLDGDAKRSDYVPQLRLAEGWAPRLPLDGCGVMHEVCGGHGLWTCYGTACQRRVHKQHKTQIFFFGGGMVLKCAELLSWHERKTLGTCEYASK